MDAHLKNPGTNAVAVAAARLFQGLRIGDIEVANRVVMAPMTRSRADEAAGDIPGSELNIEYYRQRSNAGLIITEGTPVSPLGKGYLATPGIYSDAQVEGWKKITQAVHDAGSKIVAQIWHAGRVSHPDLTGGAQPVAPSAVQPRGVAYTRNGKVELPVPQALSTEEIAGVVEAFRRGAANAIRAGFDGVEIHGATGGARDVSGFDFAGARQVFKGVYIANNGYDRDMAIDAVGSGRADAVAFGRMYIANPDLVQRFKANAALNAPNPQTFYVPGPAGYIDYPALAEAA
ncbi:hypothetical protein [Noviherbaspirillum sedimenti]|uniref:NADH:flavin oxidoreductase/NADH oxidase N-terminal domain-containing protein n=1 Tax=Noviherbaspirillum sedimenti TaxID=2320865 RepID=A0A3A3G4E7_9BURK|nr:hypothetical protein [Noviherbaspirillum sedimenti]RJG02535.1 hypothetical protein D3878_13915 [Noviherbaspirillum sedimenti]